MRHTNVTSVGRLLVALALAGALNPAASAQHSPRLRQFEFISVTRLPAAPGSNGRVRLWIPLPRSDKNQTVTELALDSPVALRRYRESEYGNEYFYLELPAERVRQGLEIRLHFRVVRREHRVDLNGALKAADPRGSPGRAELARATGPDRLAPITKMIVQLSEEVTRDLGTPLEKARAIYDYVLRTMRYDKSGEGWGRGDLVFACDHKRGNCTDFHALLIGLLRAAGIPARFEIGFPLPPDKKGGIIPGYHCWAQFYLEPFGWIPVDSSEAWRNPARRDYFFGAHDENRILFTVGRDIRLNPSQDGEPLNFFIYPYGEFRGQPLKGVAYQFSFRDLPASGVVSVSGDPRD